jgi:hypothetical protein
MPFPTNFQEVNMFLSKPIFANYEQQFEVSVQIIGHGFSLTTAEFFSHFTTKSIEKILSQNCLVLPSETFLFEMICEDRRKFDLLKHVQLPAVYFHLLSQFLQDINFSDVNVDLFESLRQLFAFQQDNISHHGWIENPHSCLLINFMLI